MSEPRFPQMEATFECYASTEDVMRIDTYTIYKDERVMSFEINLDLHPEDGPREACVLLTRDQIKRLYGLLGVALATSSGI